MKTKKKHEAITLKAKVNNVNFASKRVETIDVDQAILDVQYICNDSNNEVFASAYITGNVIAGDTIAKVNSTKINQSNDGLFPLGDNASLNGKKLYIVRTVTGDIGTSCVMTINIVGGYKDMSYHMSSKISGNELTFYFIAEII